MRSGLWGRCILLWAAMFVSTTIWAADTFRALTVNDGLSDLTVRAIYKDSVGYVWLGTAISLDRYDGSHFISYAIPGADENQKWVNAIAELPGGDIWMGNGMGLWRVDKSRRQLQRIAEDVIFSSVNCLLHDGAGTLYVGTNQGLFVYHLGRIEHVLIDANILSAANRIQGLCFGDAPDLLWMATTQGLYCMSIPDRTITAYPTVVGGHNKGDFSCIARIDSVLYLGTSGQGLFTFDTHSHHFSSFISAGNHIITALSSDGQRLLHVGSDGGGVHFIDTRERQVVYELRHTLDGSGPLRSNSVYSLLVDREGIIWVGFYQGGLQHTIWQDELFSVYAYPPYFDSQGMPVRSLCVHGSQKVIGTRDGLFFIDEERGIFREFTTPQLRSNMIFCCLYYEGLYYVGTYGGGMHVLDPVTLALSDFCPVGGTPFNFGHVFCARVDAEGRLWLGTSQGVYCYQSGRELYHFTSSNSRLPEGNVYEIFFDSTRKGWICTEAGVCLWDPMAHVLRTDVFPEGFIHQEKVRVVFEDSDHQLYFMPDKGPMLVSDLSMTAYHYLPPGMPLSGRDGVFMAEDDRHWLWVGTTNGLFHYDKQTIFIPYGFADGLPSMIFTFCPPCSDGEGGFWFGNSRGLLHLSAEDSARDKTPRSYVVAVTDIKINGRSAVFPDIRSQGVNLESSENNITFCFSEFSYTLPTYMNFEYRLDGVDADWVSSFGVPEATYFGLPAGSYTFYVRRMGDSESETQLRVHVAPAFRWERLVLVLIALLAAVGAYLWYRRRQAASTTHAPEAEEPPVTPQFNPVAVVDEEQSSASEGPKYRSVNLSPKDCAQIARRLDGVMHAQRLYANPDLKIADLAAAVGVSTHTLSYVFSQHMQCSYYDYVNDRRVEEFKRLLSTGESSRYTLTALASICGFSSRSSFFRYFKKAEGITPSEYMRRMGREGIDQRTEKNSSH